MPRGWNLNPAYIHFSALIPELMDFSSLHGHLCCQHWEMKKKRPKTRLPTRYSFYLNPDWADRDLRTWQISFRIFSCFFLEGNHVVEMGRGVFSTLKSTFITNMCPFFCSLSLEPPLERYGQVTSYSLSPSHLLVAKPWLWISAVLSKWNKNHKILSCHLPRAKCESDPG